MATSNKTTPAADTNAVADETATVIPNQVAPEQTDKKPTVLKAVPNEEGDFEADTESFVTKAKKLVTKKNAAKIGSVALAVALAAAVYVIKNRKVVVEAPEGEIAENTEA
jgi:hypothetical protein